MIELELVRGLAGKALENVELHKRRINALNVYPVPDGDTGTNLALTMRGIVEALEQSTASTEAQLASEIQREATMAAKGNSGVILSTIVRGMCRVLGERQQVDGDVLALALRSASASTSPSTCCRSPSTRHIPRTIVLRMTPELPFAAIVASRWISDASWSSVAAADCSRASTIPRIVSARFVPVSPSGTG